MIAAERGHAVMSINLTQDVGRLHQLHATDLYKGLALSILTEGIRHLRKLLEWLTVTAVDLQIGRKVELVADWLSRCLTQTMPKKRKDPLELQEQRLRLDAP